jgi:hypothetical protein
MTDRTLAELPDPTSSRPEVRDRVCGVDGKFAMHKPGRGDRLGGDHRVLEPHLAAGYA